MGWEEGYGLERRMSLEEGWVGKKDGFGRRMGWEEG